MNSAKVKNIVREMGPLIGLILLFIVISLLNDSFIDPSNLRNLARQISINALIAFGMTFVIRKWQSCSLLSSASFWEP